MVVEITQANYQVEVKNARGLVLLDFWGQACRYCQELAPFIEELPDRYGDAIKIGKVDISKNRRVAIELKVLGLPTIVMYRDGKEVGRLTGQERMTEDAITAFMEGFLGSQ